jgi:hypothetical protein
VLKSVHDQIVLLRELAREERLTAAVGFLFAAWFPPTVTLLVGIAIEVGLALAIRDNLTLNIVMLVHQVPWIKAWQAAGQAH